MDNIDYSGRRSAEAIEPTIKSLQKLGLSVPRKKVFNAGVGRAHAVTGHTVNGKSPSLSRGHRDNVRAACHEAIVTFNRGGSVVGLMKRLRGRLAHVRKTNPQTADRLKRKLEAAGIRV